MGKKRISRGWVTLNEAGQYLGVSSELVRRAVATGELAAYEKPATRTRGRSGTALVAVEDIDAWVRSWPHFGQRDMEVVA